MGGVDVRLRRGREALGVGFFVQGAVFALLVTRIPGLQERYGVPEAWLPAFLAAVPVLAGVGSVTAERVVRRVRPSVVLRCVQPVVCLALLAAGSGNAVWELAAALAVFGLTVGSLDASMNMLGVSLQRAYGRSIMLGFHAAYSLGGIAGASAAWAGAHWGLTLPGLYGPAVLLLVPAAVVAGRWFVDADPAVRETAAHAVAGAARFRVLVPLCVVMACAYIGDSTVSNWSATYVRDALHGSEQLSTVPYNVYMVTTLLGRTVGDAGVRRFGAVAVVRAGTLLAMGGFAVVAVAPGAWVGMLGFTVLGLGLCVIVPQTFAAAGRLFPGASDVAVARLNVFNYVGFLVGSPLVGALAVVWGFRGAMVVPMVLVAATLLYARSFRTEGAGYRGGHERPRAVDVG